MKVPPTIRTSGNDPGGNVTPSLGNLRRFGSLGGDTPDPRRNRLASTVWYLLNSSFAVSWLRNRKPKIKKEKTWAVLHF